MKVVVEEKNIILYLNKYYIQNINFSDKEILQNYLKELLHKLEDNYHLEIEGYYDITIYIDKNYGIIIEIKKEELEYLEYFSTKVEINTKIIEDSFLYEIINLEKEYSKDFYIYTLKDHIYLKPKKNLSNIQTGLLVENVIKIIYGTKMKNIIKKAKEVIICENQ